MVLSRNKNARGNRAFACSNDVGFFHYLCQQFFTYLAQFSLSMSSDKFKRRYSPPSRHSSQ
ncbi:MAG: hypothetical protein EPO09_18935 [Aquabacterium sp.]|nr:MAG: hypothetical protein EPO09_18935 [Aquabacterium sp.]